MNLESFDALEGDGISAEAVEKFQEKVRESQARIKQIKKEEGKVIKKDKRLGGIISGLIKKGSNPELLLLIAKLLKKNFSSSFILGILSLISEDSQKIINEKFQLKAPEENQENQKSLEVPGDLPPHIKNMLGGWVENMWIISSENPAKITGFLFSGDIIEPLAVQLSTFIIQDYLSKNQCNAQWEKTAFFAEQFLKNLGEKLKEELSGQKLIE